jgi:glycerophosphoryl diester phosphodiesterase
LIAPAQPPEQAASPITRGHAHNDYEHKRPLRDALDQGFCSVEADIWLTKDGLLVAHSRLDLKPERTLQKLYLDPLRERIQANSGKVYPNGPPFYLLIDVKSEAKETYAELSRVLEGYAEILSVTRAGKTEKKAITVVVSGNCDREAIAKQPVRYAAIDGRPLDLDSDAPADLIPWVSASWAAQFKWNGTGPMPEAERATLKDFVTKAHKHGRLVRFWATPEKPEIWRELLAADVDLINTDKLAELRAFLLKDEKR